MSTVAMAQRVQELDRLYLAWHREMARYRADPTEREQSIRVTKARKAYYKLVAAYGREIEPPDVDDVIAAADRDVALASGETKELTE